MAVLTLPLDESISLSEFLRPQSMTAEANCAKVRMPCEQSLLELLRASSHANFFLKRKEPSGTRLPPKVLSVHLSFSRFASLLSYFLEVFGDGWAGGKSVPHHFRKRCHIKHVANKPRILCLPFAFQLI